MVVFANCACCNATDPPVDCYCGDLCLYTIKITAPAALGPVPAVPCTPEDGQILALEEAPCADCTGGQGYSSTSSYIEILPPIIGGLLSRQLTGKRVCTALGAVTLEDESYYPLVNWSAEVSASFKCFTNESNEPQYYVAVSLAISIGSDQFQGLFSKSSNVLLATECTTRPASETSCGDENIPPRRAEWSGTAIDIDVSWDEVNGAAWQYDNGSGALSFSTEAENNFLLSCRDALIPSVSAVFQFAKRQFCRTKECDCGVSLEGLLATFEGVELTIGEYYDETVGSERILHFLSNLDGLLYFIKYTYVDTSLGPAVGEELKVTLVCETDEESDPQVQRWFAVYESRCTTVDFNTTNITEETIRTEIGYFECEESQGCAGRTEGELIPSGSPQAIEEVDGSPTTTDGLAPCTPPSRASISIAEDCGSS